MFDNEIILREEQIDEEFTEIADLGRIGFVFQKLADHSQVLSLLIRYESSLTRLHDRTYKHLQKLRNETNPSPRSPRQIPIPPPFQPHASAWG